MAESKCYIKSSYLEWRTGVTWPCRKVKRDDEINPPLGSQDQGIWQVKCKPTVHYMNLFAFDIQWLIYLLKFIGILRKKRQNRNELNNYLTLFKI
jgi:hypothetical protein